MSVTKTWMFCISIALAVGILMLPASVQAAPTFVNAANPDLPDQARGVPMGGALRVFGLDLDGYGEVTLQLTRFSIFAEDATIEVVGGPVTSIPTDAYFRGFEADDPDSLVLFVVPENPGRRKIHGLITKSSGAWLLEGQPGGAGLRSRKVDLETELAGKTFECGSEMLPLQARDLLPPADATGDAEAAGIPVDVRFTAHMIIDTDYEYWQKFWNLYGPDPDRVAAEALSYLGDLLAYASIPYEREIHTNLLITYARLFATDSDPYVENDDFCGCDGYGKLDEVQDAWSGNSMERTLVHFISGKTEGCGCAYVGVLCSQSDGYGASSSIGTGFNIDDPGFMWEGMVIAHEIGHNFDSQHTHNYCGEAGIAEPVDICVDDATDGVANCWGDNNRSLPGLDSLTGGTPGNQNGTIMSYCHLESGSYANIAHTFGLYQPYGKAPWRVVSKMQAHVAESTSCMGLEYSGADLSIFKDCKPDDPMLVGDTATCTIVVENYGPSTALGITTVDHYLSNGTFSFGAISVTKGDTPMPANTCSTTSNPQDQSGDVTCDLGDLDSGHIITIEIPVSADSAQDINNRVEVFSDTLDPDTSDNIAEDSVSVVESADLQLSKDCKPDDFVLAGDEATCTLWVDNLGPSTADNVQLEDSFVSDGSFSFGLISTTAGFCSPPSSDNVSCNLGDIPSGERVTVVIPVSADEGADINNNATVFSDTLDPNSNNNTAADHITVKASSDLSLTKSANASVDAGAQLTYTLQVTNNGPSTAENVVIEDVLPAGVSIDSVSATGGTCNAGVPGDAALPTRCTVDTMAPSAIRSMTIVVTVHPDTTGTLLNNGKVSSDTYDPDNSNNLDSASTDINVATGLSVTKTDDVDPVPAGSELKYTVVVDNAGPSTATMVDLVDTLPPEVDLIGSMILEGSGSCVQSASDPDIVACALDPLDPGEMFKVVLTVLVDSSVPNGTIISNQAEVFENDVLQDSVVEETTVIAIADLWIDKTGNILTSNSSGTLEYRLTVHNDTGCSGDDPQVCGNGGPSDALNVQVIDVLPLDPKKLRVEFVSEDCAYDEASHTVTCMTAVLPAGSSVVHIIQADVKGNSDLHNEAEVSSTTTDPNSANNSDQLDMSVKGGKGNPHSPS